MEGALYQVRFISNLRVAFAVVETQILTPLSGGGEEEPMSY